MTTTFHRLLLAARIFLNAAFVNRSLIFLLTPAWTEAVDLLASSASESTREAFEEPAPAPFTFAPSFTVAALSTLTVTAAERRLCVFLACSFWTGLGCFSTRNDPLMKGWIRQKYV